MLRSDLTIKNPEGQEVTQKDALPNLVRLGASAGAVVFFSAQQAARVRAYGDLTRFHEVLYAHLNLVEAERLRADMHDLLEEQFEILRQRAQDLQSVEDELREAIKGVDGRLDEILRSPPWELEELPTRPASEARIRSFVPDLAAQLGANYESGTECARALEQTQAWIRELSSKDRAELNRSGSAANEEHAQVSKQVAAIREAEERGRAALARVTELTARFGEITGGHSLQELATRRDAVAARLDREGQQLLARQAVARLLALGHDASECPICGKDCDGGALSERITRSIEQAGSDQEEMSAEAETLRRQLTEAEGIAKARDTATQQAEDAAKRRDELVAALAKLLGCAHDGWAAAAEMRLGDLRRRANDLQQEGERASTRETAELARISALTMEWRYHQLRDQMQRLRQELKEGLEPARDRLHALEEFRATVERLERALREEFDAAVDRALPVVSGQLTATFQRLTGHPAFDRLRVERAEGPDKLVVQVGSSRAPVPWSRPEDVLNQGAYTALGLVPHFVFSGFHAEQAELNVLIVDDPSQSFDTSHVELLLEELRRAAEHAQLLLATHEEERFRPIVEKLFPPESFAVIRVVDFAPGRGPTIERG